MNAPADFQHDAAEGTLRFSGNLSLRNIDDLPTRLGAVEGEVRRLDMRGIDRIDTVGAWLIHRFARDHDAQVTGLDANQQLLFDHVAAADHPIQAPPKPMGAFAQLLAEIGEAVVQAIKTMYGLLGFMGATAVAAARVIANPRRFRYHATVHRFEVVGVSALGIIGLMSFLIGIVIAQQGAVQLRQFGAEVFTINLVGRITLRELGILMTAIMVAGRSGSAFAAQLGTMKLTEEIDAMRTIGVNPMEALVLPRVIAAVLMLPLLGFYASLLGMIGGGLLCWIALDIPPITFVQRLREVVPITDLYVGLVKAPVFGAIIAIAGCYQGMQVESDAEQVGLRTTTAVVQAIFLVIVLDAFFAVFFTEVGVELMTAPIFDGEEAVIRIRGLRNSFGDQVVHENLDLDVRPGEILGVVGGSGTGKSVLMRSIIGLQPPDAGEVHVFGESVIDADERQAIEIRRRWGVLFQGGALFSTLTVAENVQVPLKEFYPQLDPQLLAEIAAYKVVMTGLPPEAGPKYPSELSGGMKKRAGLSRSLALDPELLFLDEPTAGLDPIGAAAFDELTRSLQQTLGLTVFLITHDLDTLYAICDRVAVLADKRVIAVGTIDELLALDHPWIQEYFNGPRGRAAVASAERAVAKGGERD